MTELYKNIGSYTPAYLLASAEGADRIAVNVAPGAAAIARGTVLFRNADGMFEPAAAADIVNTKELVILDEDADVTQSETVAIAACAYRAGHFIRKYVKDKTGTAITKAHELVLRQQNMVMEPMDDWTDDEDVFDNTETVSVTVQNDGHGTGSASPSTGAKGTVVTLTATPSSGYQFDAWEVVSGDVTIGSDNKFTIGDKAVTVKATFKSA